MKKILFWGLFLLCGQSQAQNLEPPNFSILGQLGMGTVSGFLGNGNPAPGGGLWLGISIADDLDGLWGMDYYTMPNQEITVALNPTKLNPNTSMNVLPTDDISLTVNIRWYWWRKYDSLHQHFNTVPYLVVGGGMDLVVDQDPRPPNSNFYSASYDELLGLNLGIGLDCPLGDGKQWFLYAEGMDHLIAWQSLTQVYSVRAGFKVMLDAAHIDPFRGLF